MITTSVFDTSQENEFNLYHGGPRGQKKLIADPNKTWGRVSSHIYFLANRRSVERHYTRGEGKDERVLYVVDSRLVPAETLTVPNGEAVWYDEIRDLEGALKVAKQNPGRDVKDFFQDPDFAAFRKYLEKHELQTPEDVGRRLEEAKKEWFEKNTKPFDINLMTKYRKRKTIVMVPGPIEVV